jgi:hypothetical protein
MTHVHGLDFMNAQYYTEITLGNPPQTVSLLMLEVLDTHRARSSRLS